MQLQLDTLTYMDVLIGGVDLCLVKNFLIIFGRFQVVLHKEKKRVMVTYGPTNRPTDRLTNRQSLL